MLTTNTMDTATALAAIVNETTVLQRLGIRADAATNPKGIEVRIGLHGARIGQARFYDGRWHTENRAIGGSRPTTCRILLEATVDMVPAVLLMTKCATLELLTFAAAANAHGIGWEPIPMVAKAEPMQDGDFLARPAEG